MCERVKELNYVCHTHTHTHTHTKCLARPVVGLNPTLTTFEKAMFLSYLRMARWFSPKSLNFSSTYRMALSLKMSEMVYESKFS